jgi:AcrR family transcriptional regulator
MIYFVAMRQSSIDDTGFVSYAGCMSDGGTRRRILTVTRELLRQQEGLNVITVGKVAAAAHISRATLYRYFPDKATLLRAAGVDNEQLATAVKPRVRILEAVIEIAGERGMHATTLEEIANRAGLSLSGLHWHYKNKDELIADLAQYLPLVPAMEAEVLQAESEDANLELQLRHLSETLLKSMDKYREIARFAIFEAAVYPDITRFASKHTMGRIIPLLMRLFAEHARRGELRPGSAQVRAQAFMGMFMLLVLLRPAFSSLLAPDDEETAKEYIDILLHGILDNEMRLSKAGKLEDLEVDGGN